MRHKWGGNENFRKNEKVTFLTKHGPSGPFEESRIVTRLFGVVVGNTRGAEKGKIYWYKIREKGTKKIVLVKADMVWGRQ